MATAALVAAVGLQAVNTIQGSISQASAQKMEASFKSQQLQTNSRLADIQAKDAILRGKQNAEAHKRKIKKLIGAQRAAMAAQGIDVDFGTALEIQLETAEFGAEDALTIKNNAFREATGYKIDALDLSSQARFTELAGKNRARNTLITGGLTAVTGLASGINRIRTQ